MTGTGCGAPAPNGPATGTSSSGTSPTVASSSPRTSTYLPQPEPELSVPSGATGLLERLTGVIGAGVESGCRILQVGGGRGVQLVGGDARLVVGATVTVEGRRAPGLATTCQEGTPFVVTVVLDATPPPGDAAR